MRSIREKRLRLLLGIQGSNEILQSCSIDGGGIRERRRLAWSTSSAACKGRLKKGRDLGMS